MQFRSRKVLLSGALLLSLAAPLVVSAQMPPPPPPPPPACQSEKSAVSYAYSELGMARSNTKSIYNAMKTKLATVKLQKAAVDLMVEGIYRKVNNLTDLFPESTIGMLKTNMMMHKSMMDSAQSELDSLMGSFDEYHAVYKTKITALITAKNALEACKRNR